MPSIEELQRFQFEDFALENTRRGKLTVLGEHTFGAEQGRIVTAPVTAESSGGGGGGTTPPEEKTGACCIDGTCSIMTAADCGSAGGVYQGDNSVCDPNPCFTCPEITLACDSISASKSKDLCCRGFLSIGGVDYRVSHVNRCSGATSFSDVITGAHYYRKFRQTFTGIDCPGEGVICSGTAVVEYDCRTASVAGCSPATDEISCVNTDFTCTPSRPLCDCPGFQNNCNGYWIKDSEYYDEYTTAELISDTEDALPSHDDDFDDTCSSYRNLASDESSYSIRRFKYKFTFASSSGFRISWVERFTPEGGGSPTDTDKYEDITVDSTESSVYTVSEPGTDGTITIEDITCEAIPE